MITNFMPTSIKVADSVNNQQATATATATTTAKANKTMLNLKVDKDMSVRLRAKFEDDITEIVRIRSVFTNKYNELGGATGQPIGTFDTGAGNGYFQRYQNGIIYYLPPHGPCWVHGAILDEYLSLGAEGGLLGYPITDETPTPGNSGRYNHFERGSIYWTYTTGAHEIHGAIRDKWASIGWEKSWLGFPISDEKDFTEGGRFSQFQNGVVYWWPDIGAIEIGNVSLQYKGLYCFGETDWDRGTDSDEPYAIFGVVPAPPYQPSEVITQIYGDVDSGDSRPDSVELYRGLPNGTLVTTKLLESDDGDPNKYRQQVTDLVTKLGTAVGGACGALFGPESAQICEKTWNDNSKEIIDAVNSFIGSGDDELGNQVRHFTAKEMVTLASTPRKNFWGIEYHIESELFDREGASYKVYFAIERV